MGEESVRGLWGYRGPYVAYCEPASGIQKSSSCPLWTKPSLHAQPGYRPSSGPIKSINNLLLWLIQPGSLGAELDCPAGNLYPHPQRF